MNCPLTLLETARLQTVHLLVVLAEGPAYFPHA